MMTDQAAVAVLSAGDVLELVSLRQTVRREGTWNTALADWPWRFDDPHLNHAAAERDIPALIAALHTHRTAVDTWWRHNHRHSATVLDQHRRRQSHRRRRELCLAAPVLGPADATELLDVFAAVVAYHRGQGPNPWMSRPLPAFADAALAAACGASDMMCHPVFWTQVWMPYEELYVRYRAGEITSADGLIAAHVALRDEHHGEPHSHE